MKFKSFISKILVFIMTLTIISTCQNAVSVKADSFKVVTLGADLTEEQKSQMLKYFNVTEMMLIYLLLHLLRNMRL